MGLAFKPNTDDIRDASSLALCHDLLESGATIHLHDPMAMENFKKFFPETKQVRYFKDSYETLKGSDCLVICTEWSQFAFPDFDRIAENVSSKTIIDGRNMYFSFDLAKYNLSYESIGHNDQKTYVYPTKIEHTPSRELRI